MTMQSTPQTGPTMTAGGGNARSAERSAGDTSEVAVECLAGLGGQRGERDHSGEDDVAQLGLDVCPGMGDAKSIAEDHPIGLRLIGCALTAVGPARA